MASDIGTTREVVMVAPATACAVSRAPTKEQFTCARHP
jgi:hypothetical protein